MTAPRFVRDDDAVETMTREARIEYLAPYARAIAIRHCRTNGVLYELDAMISDAYLGAIAAVDTWDGTRSLSGWASYKIPRAMMDAFRARTQRGKVAEFEAPTDAAPGDSSDGWEFVSVLHAAHPQHPRHEDDLGTFEAEDLLASMRNETNAHVLREVYLRDRPKSSVARDLGVGPSRITQRIRAGLDECRELLAAA